MEKKKIGLWLPFRESLTEFTIEKPGIFLKEIRNSVVRELKKEESVELLEDLDFRKAIIKNGKAYLGRLCLNDLDLFFWFGEINREEGSYHLKVLDAIENDAIVVNSPLSVRIGLDKFKTSSLLAKNGINVADFALVSKDNVEDAKKLLREWKEVVAKPRFGSFGVGIVRINDEQTLLDTLDYSKRDTYFIERFVPNDIRFWSGINLIGGKFVYAYCKKAKHIAGGWKIQDRKRKGGEMVICKPTDEQLEIAQRVAELFKLDLIGVDMIKGNDGKYYVVDVNTFPGLYPDMFSRVKINGANAIADTIKTKL